MVATCMEDHVSACKNSSACMEYCVSMCTDGSSDNMGMHRSNGPYISTKGTGMHIFTSTDESKLNTFVRGIMDTYYNCGRYEPIWRIGKDVVGKVRKGMSYSDTLQQSF